MNTSFGMLHGLGSRGNCELVYEKLLPGKNRLTNQKYIGIT